MPNICFPGFWRIFTGRRSGRQSLASIVSSPLQTGDLGAPLETVIDSHVKLQAASRRGSFPHGLTGCNFCPESGASFHHFPNPNLNSPKTPLLHPAHNKKTNTANAKLINRTPAARAPERCRMPRREYCAPYVSDLTITLGVDGTCPPLPSPLLQWLLLS